MINTRKYAILSAFLVITSTIIIGGSLTITESKPHDINPQTINLTLPTIKTPS